MKLAKKDKTNPYQIVYIRTTYNHESFITRSMTFLKTLNYLDIKVTGYELDY